MKQKAESRTSFGAVCATPKKQTVRVTRSYRRRISDALATTDEAGKRLMVSMIISYEEVVGSRTDESPSGGWRLLYSKHTGPSGCKFLVDY
jgi:hypothetical protein